MMAASASLNDGVSETTSAASVKPWDCSWATIIGACSAYVSVVAKYVARSVSPASLTPAERYGMPFSLA